MYCNEWPDIPMPNLLFNSEQAWAKRNGIRAPKHYPQTIEDVQSYFSQLESVSEIQQ